MRRSRVCRGVATLLVLLAVAACGHTPVVVPLQPVEEYAFRQLMGEVRVAADPFFTRERLQPVFTGGEDFAEKGLLPVRVVIENGSAEEVVLALQDARLLRPDGRSYLPLLPYDAFSLIKLGVGWWAVGAGFVGGAAPAYRNEARQKDIDQRALRDGKIPGGGSASGFLYFSIAEATQNLAGHRLVLPLSTAGGRGLPFEIAIAGRREAGSAPPQAPEGPKGPNLPERQGTPSGGGVIIRSPARP
jgi:hypothetical protein